MSATSLLKIDGRKPSDDVITMLIEARVYRMLLRSE